MTPAAPPPPPASGRGRVVAVATLAAIALLQLAAYAWYSPGNDWARDLFVAARIADGGDWPARGPVIGGLFHTGPLWYFVVALPVALGAGFAATTVFVGALALLKIPLAARLGWRLDGWRLAIPFAALVAVPGWNVLESLQLTHTALLQTLAIAVFLPLLTLWRDGAPRHWLVFGALAGLAVQAHPVAGVLAVPALAVAWRRRARLRGDLVPIAGGLAIALLPSVPMLIAEARDGWPALAALAAAPSGPARSVAGEAFALAAALTIGPVDAMRDWLPSALAAVPGVLGTAIAVAWLASLPSLRGDPPARTRIACAAALLLVSIAWLLAVHVRVPFYMAAIATPIVAFVLAEGIAAAGDAMRRVGMVAAMSLAAIAPLSVIATMHRGHADVALASIHDIRTAGPPRVPLALMPMWAFDVLAKRACGHAELRVHGELGALVDFYQGRPFADACGGPVAVRLGGPTGADGVLDWAGTTPHTLRLLGDPSPSWQEALSLAPRQTIAPSMPVDVATAVRYPHRAVCSGQAAAHRVAFTASAADAVAIHSPLFAFDGFALVGATRDGEPVAPASHTNGGALFLPHGTAPNAWVLDYIACDPAAVDVVTLPVIPR